LKREPNRANSDTQLCRMHPDSYRDFTAPMLKLQRKHKAQDDGLDLGPGN